MSKFPFLPLDVDSYFGATRHLSTEQHGAYLLLLMEAWRRPNCTIPDDDEKLARLTGLDLMKWHSMKADVMAFWDYDGRSKSWVQKRLKKERNYVADVKQKKRDSAASRWNKKKKTHANAYASAMQHSPSLSQGNNNHSSESVDRSQDDMIFSDLGRWFTDADIAFLQTDHNWIDVRRKVSERSFYQWAASQDSRNPVRVAMNWFNSNKEKHLAEQSLTNRLKVLNGGRS